MTSRTVPENVSGLAVPPGSLTTQPYARGSGPARDPARPVRAGRPAKAADCEALDDLWQASVESWTATDNGPYSPRPYYLRVTKDAMPNVGTRYTLGDNFVDESGDPTVDQREIVDNSFLGLVLFGVKKWDDPTVLNSLEVGDRTNAWPLRDDTPNGPVWHRFTFDGYGEQADG
jgi:glucoamylase